ncbi:ABC transporter substrate-binding protein [Sphingomonas sp.]|uniref:ABC transporter substrate-binding protein n=1 Tax=Sphingomonas sp. TaxID=28214 RepID=UPI003F7218B4
MTDNLMIGRRGFLAGAAASAWLVGGPVLAGGRRYAIRVASNQGSENATLQQMIVDLNLFDRFSLDAVIVDGRTISAPMEALLADQADVCMISGFVGVLPAIEAGKELRLIGAAMEKPALALYSMDVARVEDLAGRTIGIGATKGLLHILTVALLRKKGVDPASVEFVNVGSNAQVMEAVLSGTVDAGLSGIAGVSDSRARVVAGGELWRELPDYTYQTAYASLRAIRDNPEAVARCLAAYSGLFRYLSSPSSKLAYLEARRKAAGQSDPAEAEAVWNFIQKHQPYGRSPGLSIKRVDYLQSLNVEVGLQAKGLPFDAVAAMGPALRARQLL